MKTTSDKKDGLPAGLSAPARRALASAHCFSLEQVAGLREEDVRNLHGIGPRALELLREALRAKGLKFSE